jgi:flagellar hook-basal body complex protein FliE
VEVGVKMISNDGGFNIPLTLKQMESSAFLDNKPEALDESSGKVLESFGNILKTQIEETNKLKQDSNKAQEIFATGGNISLHEVMIKAEKAGMAMELTLQLRNKLLSAYKDIQNMHV